MVRQAVIASSFGLRFQGLGYFLTDARTHRGTSGAPVVMHSPSTDPQLPWKLLGVHSARMDMGGCDLQLDETLGSELRLVCGHSSHSDDLKSTGAINTSD